MKEIDWNHPKLAANPAVMAMAWQVAMVTTIREAYMEKYFPQTLSVMKQFNLGDNL